MDWLGKSMGARCAPFTDCRSPVRRSSPSTEIFSLVSQTVLQQPPSANKKKNYEIQEVLGTGSFGKVMVPRCALPSRPSRSLACQSKIWETNSHLKIRREIVYSTCAKARDSSFHLACSGHLSPVSRR